MLQREGADDQVSEMFYTAVVQKRIVEGTYIEEMLVVGKQIAILFVSLPLSEAPIPYCCRIRLRVGA